MPCRLVNPLVLVLERIEPTASRTAGAYDDDFRDFALQSATQGVGSTLEVPATHEVRAQLDVREFEAFAQNEAGYVPSTRLEAHVTRRDMQRAGLLQTDETLLVGVNTKLLAVKRTKGGTAIPLVNAPVVTEARPSSYGCGRVQSWLLVFGERSKGGR